MLASWTLPLHTAWYNNLYQYWYLYYSLWAYEYFKHSAFTFAWSTSDYAVYCCMFCTIRTSASYIVCSILLCALGIADLCHVTASYVPCYGLPCCVMGTALCHGHCCFIYYVRIYYALLYVCAKSCFIYCMLYDFIYCTLCTATCFVPHCLFVPAHFINCVLYAVTFFMPWALLHLIIVWCVLPFAVGTATFLPRVLLFHICMLCAATGFVRSIYYMMFVMGTFVWFHGHCCFIYCML